MQLSGTSKRKNSSAKAPSAVPTPEVRQQTNGRKRRKPVWNEEDRVLVVDGVVLHEFPERATKLTWLLRFFEEWGVVAGVVRRSAAGNGEQRCAAAPQRRGACVE